jgi:hypothetical protein
MPDPDPFAHSLINFPLVRRAAERAAATKWITLCAAVPAPCPRRAGTAYVPGAGDGWTRTFTVSG